MIKHWRQIFWHWHDALKHPIDFTRWMISWQGCSEENVSFDWFREHSTEGNK